MENQYGRVAIHAVEEYTGAPSERWTRAVQNCIENSASSSEKSCPKSTFLALCGEGFVKGIAAGRYTASPDNKVYALGMLELLRSGMPYGKSLDLWRAMLKGRKVNHNGQADVVLALWNKELLT